MGTSEAFMPMITMLSRGYVLTGGRERKRRQVPPATSSPLGRPNSVLLPGSQTT